MNTEQESLQNHLLNASNTELLQVINNSGNLYRTEVVHYAQEVARSKGLISSYPDIEFKVITTGGRENGPLDAGLIKEIYLKGLINDETLVHVDSCSKWLPLREVLTTNGWKQTNIDEDSEFFDNQGRNDTHKQNAVNQNNLNDVKENTTNTENINKTETMFYLSKNSQQFGPYTETEVINLLNSEQFTLNNLACRQGMNEWVDLGSLLKNTKHLLNTSNNPSMFSPIKPPKRNFNSFSSIRSQGGLFAGIVIAVLITKVILFTVIIGRGGNLGVLDFVIAIVIATGITSFFAKKRMEKTLGRKNMSETQLTSINTWMDFEDKSKK